MINLDAEQLEQLREIGSYLSQVRQDQSKTLEEISTKTFIPIRLLKAIEAAQEKTLPEPVFIQGFIRRYGDALGLNGKEISQRFNVNPMPTPTIELTPEPTVSEPMRPAFAANALRLPNPASRASNGSLSNGTRHTANGNNSYGNNGNNGNNSSDRRSVSDAFDDRSSQPAKPPYALILGAAAIALAGLFFGVIRPGLEQQATSNNARSTQSAQQSAPQQDASSSSASAPISQLPPATTTNSTQSNASPTDSTQTTSTQTSPAPTLAGSAIAPNTTPSPANSAANSTSAQKAPVVVTVNVTDESWVEIIVDGKRQFEGILQKGFKKTWSAKQNLTISSGNAGAVSVSYNNGAAKPLGEMGAIETKSFTPANSPNASPTP